MEKRGPCRRSVPRRNRSVRKKQGKLFLQFKEHVMKKMAPQMSTRPNAKPEIGGKRAYRELTTGEAGVNMSK